MNLRVCPILNRDKNVSCLSSTIIDIFECKMAEKAVTESEIRYRQLFETAQDGILMLNAHTGQITDANPSLINMLGYSLETLLGMKLWDMCIFRDVRKIQTVFSDIEIEGCVRFQQLTIITKSGRCIDVELIAEIYRVDQSKVVQCNIHDITEGMHAHKQIKESLKEKEILLREIHHRVKNNMQIISSLLRLQSRYIKDKKYRVLFEESQNTIRSLSLIHEKLYNSEDMSRVDFRDYIGDLVKSLFHSYGVNSSLITARINIENVSLGIDFAIPCGLIVNELITNSLKHAFPNGRKGEIKIVFSKINEKIYELFVGDNGVGIPENIELGNTESLGLRLVTMLVNDQLEGEIDLMRNNGTKFRIVFKGVDF